MKIIRYIHIYTYLIRQEDMGPWEAAVAIDKVRRLPRELKSAVSDVLDGVIPRAEYHGVTLQSLIDDDRLSPVRAVLMLDWVRREPAVAMRYMALERAEAPQQITDEERAMLARVLEKMESDRQAAPAAPKDDIEIPD